MQEPLTRDANDDGKLERANDPTVTGSTMTIPAATARPVSVWKPVLVRVAVGGLALLGLAGVGAASMLAGLDGARANPPVASSFAEGPAVTSAAGPSVSASSASGAVAAPTPAASSAAPTPAPEGCAVGRMPDGRVILNTATAADLRTLSGIGEKRAQAILSLRAKLKRFRRVQELRRVRGIGAKTLQRLAPKLLVDPPAEVCGVASAPPAAQH